MIYKLDTPTTVDDTVSNLHEYHPDIESAIGDVFIGLTGQGDMIQTVVVDGELGDGAKSDLEDFLGTSISARDETE